MGRGYLARMAGTGCASLGCRRRRPIRMVLRAGQAPGPMRRHPGRRPDTSLLRRVEFSPARVGEGGFGPGRAERDETAQGLRDALREGGPASRPEGAGIPCRWGAGERAKPHSSNHHGPFARAPQVRTSSGHRDCSHAAGEVFARGILAWDGGAGKGRSVEIAACCSPPQAGENKKRHLVRKQKTPKASPPPGS
jgi:hypothetical protein